MNIRVGERRHGLAEKAYQETAVTLSPGDRLCVYSDGITEVASPEAELFGEPRLLEALSPREAGDLEARLDGLFETLEHWRGGASGFKDDLSVTGFEIK